MGRGRVWVVGVYGSWVGSLLAMGARHSWWWVVVVHGWGIVICGTVVCGWWGGESSWSLGVVAWVLFVGAGYCLWALGVARAHWVPLWVLGIVRGRWVVVGCVLWALGLLRMRSLFRVGLLLGVRSLLRALVVLGFSWDEHGGVGIITYRDVTMNDDFRSSFVVQLPRRCQRCGSCERGRSGGGLPPLVVAGCVRWWVVVALRSQC